MAMFERRLFKKPICVTQQDMSSGVSSTIGTWTSFFSIPWNKLGYLKRIEIGKGCNGASGCVEFDIWDDFYDPITEVSGLVKRKSITIPNGTAQINWDETQDIPLLGNIYAYPSISGLDATICARLM